MLKTCNMEVLKTRIGLLTPTEGFVILQLMENLFEDSVKNNVGENGAITEEVLINTVKATNTVVMNLFKEVAIRVPNTRFAVEKPITRPSLVWYSERFKSVTALFENELDQLNLPTVRKIKSFAVESQVFDDGGLHLTQESGDILVESILMASETFFGEAVGEVEVMEVDQVKVASPPIQGDPAAESKSELVRIVDLEVRMKAVEEKGKADNLIFARHREDLDLIVNEKKEDRLIITRLTNPTPMPVDQGAKKIWLDKMVADVLCRIDPEGKGNIIFIKQGRNEGRQIPMVEVRMESKEVARRIRGCFSVRKKKTTILAGYLLPTASPWLPGSGPT